jgi:predicted deacylase
LSEKTPPAPDEESLDGIPAPPPPEPAAPRSAPKARPLSIAGEPIRLNEIRDVQLPFSETYLGRKVTIPVRVIRAKRSGPKVFLTGGVHGDELTGIGTIRELLYDDPPRLAKGTLVCAPAVNIFGLESQSRYLPDRRDLNRCFPGLESGSLASRLARAFFSEVVLKCDWGIDFHSAASTRINYPNVRADLRDQRIRDLAMAFGGEIVLDGKGPDGSLRREAVKAGIPTIILEAGEAGKIDMKLARAGARGVMNVLRWLGMVEGEPERPPFRVVARKRTWVRAERGGFLEVEVRPGDLVKAGQPLATNYSIFGRERNVLIAPDNCLVLGSALLPAVKPGDPVCHLALLSDKAFERVRRSLLDSPDPRQRERVR